MIDIELLGVGLTIISPLYGMGLWTIIDIQKIKNTQKSCKYCRISKKEVYGETT